jgi:hypothetical protein
MTEDMDIVQRLRIPVDQQDDWIIGTDKLKEEAAAEIEKLKANIAHAAGFLAGMAERIDGCRRRWDRANFAKAVRDCHAMAAALQKLLD